MRALPVVRQADALAAERVDHARRVQDHFGTAGDLALQDRVGERQLLVDVAAVEGLPLVAVDDRVDPGCLQGEVPYRIGPLREPVGADVVEMAVRAQRDDRLIGELLDELPEVGEPEPGVDDGGALGPNDQTDLLCVCPAPVTLANV